MAISKIPSAGFQDNVKFRNIIINGDMSIAQRGTSQSSVTSVVIILVIDGELVELYWHMDTITINRCTNWSRFCKVLKMDCTTADASLSSNESFILHN